MFWNILLTKQLSSNLEQEGLRSICEAIMLDAMFEMPSIDQNELTISPDYARHKLERIDLKVLKAS